MILLLEFGLVLMYTRLFQSCSDLDPQKVQIKLTLRKKSQMDIAKTIILLVLSNIFMTFAWYGHLKFKSHALWIVILISWAIAFFEYCLQVPANRLGHNYFTASQLKILQEVITFSVFALFSFYYLKEKPSFYDFISFSLIILAVFVSLLQPKI